jgi:hypothetical protein
VEQDSGFLLIRLAACLLCGWGGYALAKGKNRRKWLWFAICFFFVGIGLVVLACLPRRRIMVTLTPQYDDRKWQALVAADPAVAAGAEQLKPFGAPYVAELASRLLGKDAKLLPGPIVDGLVAKAKADQQAAADPARVEAAGRNVYCVCRSATDVVALVNDGTVLAQRGEEFRLFISVADYRMFYGDRDFWKEASLDEKRRFLAAAYPFLERVNAKVGPKKPENMIGIVRAA